MRLARAQVQPVDEQDHRGEGDPEADDRDVHGERERLHPARLEGVGRRLVAEDARDLLGSRRQHARGRAQAKPTATQRRRRRIASATLPALSGGRWAARRRSFGPGPTSSSSSAASGSRAREEARREPVLERRQPVHAQARRAGRGTARRRPRAARAAPPGSRRRSGRRPSTRAPARRCRARGARRRGGRAACGACPRAWPPAPSSHATVPARSSCAIALGRSPGAGAPSMRTAPPRTAA